MSAARKYIGIAHIEILRNTWNFLQYQIILLSTKQRRQLWFGLDIPSYPSNKHRKIKNLFFFAFAVLGANIYIQIKMVREKRARNNNTWTIYRNLVQCSYIDTDGMFIEKRYIVSIKIEYSSQYFSIKIYFWSLT